MSTETLGTVTEEQKPVSTETAKPAADAKALNVVDFEKAVKDLKRGAKAQAEVPKEPVAAPEESSPKKDSAEVAALKAELSRVREKSSTVESQASELKARLEKLEATAQQTGEKKAEGKKAITDYGDEQLLDLKFQWQDYLDDQRMAGNDQAVQLAKANLKAIEKEFVARSGNRAVKKAEKAAPSEAPISAEDWGKIYDDTMSLAPDIGNKESALWKEAKKEFDTNPVYGKLGQLGEIIAVARAVLKTKVPAQTKQVLQNIEAAAEQALSQGARGDVMSAPIDVSSMSTDQFEAAVKKLKRGRL